MQAFEGSKKGTKYKFKLPTTIEQSLFVTL